MSDVPRVSVVMAVFDGEAHLREAVESILAQTFRDWELIVVDDGSTDATPELLRELAGRDARVRVDSPGHAGLIASLNRGASLARGRYLARMDADDVALPERLERQVAFLDAHPEVALLGTAYTLIDAAGEPGITLMKPLHHAQIRRELDEPVNPFLHPSVMMHREVFEAVGGYHAAFEHAEDYDLWLRIAERHATANLPEPLLRYRVHHGQVSHRNLRQGIVSVLASQAAVRRHRETGEEPRLDGVVRADDLPALGVPRETLEAVLAEACFWQANLMLITGHEDTARELYGESLAHSDLSRLRSRLCRLGFAAYAVAHARHERFPGGGVVSHALLVATAFATRASLGRQLLRGTLQRLAARAQRPTSR